MKHPDYACYIVVLMLLLLSGFPARAELDAVSGWPDPLTPSALTEIRSDGLPDDVAISLANGFPLWYKDSSGVKLELCLEQEVERMGGGLFRPCLTEEPILSQPISFPINFGSEASYWSVTGVTTFSSTSGAGDALLVMSQQAAFRNEIPHENEQAVFSRIRLRINVPVPGDYQVSHPFGSRTYTVATVLAERDISQTQDVGGMFSLDFLTTLADATPPPSPPAPLVPSIDEAIVNQDGRSIGPFLEGNPSARVLDASGNQYLADTGADLAPLEIPLEPGPGGAVFSITLLTPPDTDFRLDAGGVDGVVDNTVTISRFQVMGKIFNDGPNLMPLAVDDFAATSPGVPVVIDVAVNDIDPPAYDPNDAYNPLNPANTNVHGLHPQGLGIVDGDSVLRTDTFTTARGATVRRITDLPTGRSRFLYTPLDDVSALGEDSFEYVIQDKGGLVSAPATVTVQIEEVTVGLAEYRPRIGKWQISGSTNDTTDNSITLRVGPRALLAGEHLVVPVASEATGTVALRMGEAGIEYQVRLDPLPLTPVQSIQLYAGAPESSGQAFFSLFNAAFEGGFPGEAEGLLTSSDLLTAPGAEISSFAAAVDKILAGEAYVSVASSAYPDGEIGGQLVSPLIGIAPVQDDGTWIFRGKSTASPGTLRSVDAFSANGNRVLGQPLLLR